jgi:hypothetical protein
LREKRRKRKEGMVIWVEDELIFHPPNITKSNYLTVVVTRHERRRRRKEWMEEARG